MKYFRKNDGITLIALVITIIVMLILATVSIRIAVNGGLFGYAGKAVSETAHQQIYDMIQLKEAEYSIAKRAQQTDINLVQTLKLEEILSDVSTPNDEKEEYLINVEKLLGKKGVYGNGTNEKNDVYKLEVVRDESINIGKIASTSPIKIAEVESIKEKKYKVMYYGETDKGNKELGYIVDFDTSSVAENLITFYILDDDTGDYKMYISEEGWTWDKWIASRFNVDRFENRGVRSETVLLQAKMVIIIRYS